MTIPAGETGAGTYLVTWNGHGDALGLWKQNADGTLTLANSYTYGTSGTPTTATHNGTGDLGLRFLYVGASDVQWDDFSGAGLAYMHARHYRPAIGRFLQPDPSAAEANLYGYALENPVTLLDPSGAMIAVCFNPFGFWFCVKIVVETVAAGATVAAAIIGFAALTLGLRSDTAVRPVAASGLVMVGGVSWYEFSQIVSRALRIGAAMQSMQREIRTGNAPKGIERLDPPHTPRDKPHIHVNDGAINLDGSIRHKLGKPLNNGQKAWLRKHGIPIPGEGSKFRAR